MEEKRIIKTGLYGEVNKGIMKDVLGQMSAGRGF